MLASNITRTLETVLKTICKQRQPEMKNSIQLFLMGVWRTVESDARDGGDDTLNFFPRPVP